MSLRVAGAQLNLTVGDLEGNEARIADAMDWAEAEGADVLLLPELAVTGYPPEDLVIRPSFVDDNIAAVRRLARRSGNLTTFVGFVDHSSPGERAAADAVDRRVANAVAVITSGEIQGIYHKVLLPNYGVFDEDRYFSAGLDADKVFEVSGHTVGLSICEDIWVPDGPPRSQAEAGAGIILNVNASPFHRGKAGDREEMLSARARAAQVPVVYVNLVGGQDELVFDGASVIIDAHGTVLHRSPQFLEDLFVVEVPVGDTPGSVGDVAPLLDPTEEIYRALVTGLGDYCRKNGFTDVVLGLSGGIDSALTAAIAADALGGEHVWGISMPSRYSSEGSVTDSKALAANFGLRFDVIPMDEIFASYLDALEPVFEGTEMGVAEENIQSRIRGALLMAVSNKHGPMVVATGNKSEMAAGYATLYGDMAGGYAVLKDVFKTVVFDLARWRNRNGEMIPQNTIDKPPSAELRPDQKDSDSLPEYALLDAVLERYIEDDLGPDEIIAEGFDPEVVRWTARLVDRNEYKRRQAAPGVKITTKAFGRDRRLPITNHYRP
jgi:NAD+ synthase (glutamine-hydrolysing)